MLQALLEQARDMRRRGRRAAATDVLRTLVATYPRSALGWYELAVTLDNRGLEHEAIPLYRKALRLGLPKRLSRLAWTWLGSSLRKTGRARAALRCFERARDDGNRAAYVDGFAGHALLALGRYASASDAFANASRREPEKGTWAWHQRRAAALARKADLQRGGIV